MTLAVVLLGLLLYTTTQRDEQSGTVASLA